MDISGFWQLIDESLKSHTAGSEEQTDWIEAQLKQRGEPDTAGFQRCLSELRQRAFRWDLWHAAYVALGGCGDDGFEYFTGWLIARGQTAYEAVLENPDNLVDHLPDDRDEMWCEEMLYVTYDLLDDAKLEALAQEFPLREPGGEEFDFDDEGEATRRLPRLSQLA